MEYAVDMGSRAMIYVPSFIQIGSGIQKLMGRCGSQTDTQITRRLHKRTFGK
jgi:hypothetical protein